MRYMVFVVVVLCVLTGRAMGDESALNKVDISALEKWALSESRMDARDVIVKLIRGEYETDFDALWYEVKSIVLGEIKSAAKYLALLLAPCFILAALRAIYPGGDALCALSLICSMSVIATLITVFGECVDTARGFLTGVGEFNESVYPVMASVLALSGKAAASALFTPSAALIGSLVSSGIAVYSPIFASVAAILASAGQMSQRIRLDGLGKFVKRVYGLCLGAAMTVAICLISARGGLSRGYDSSSVQTAKFTIGSLLPIVGGEVADSVDALVASASLMRNAVGVTGIILLLSYCLKPLIRLTVLSLAARLASAIVEPLDAGQAQKTGERFADAVDMLLAACASASVLMIVLLGAATTLFGG